ncbi:MAG: DUF1570 domain-containing protein [Planctomycetes bacterium]|nr:DUF1570 domain-containing protein [Planctomycetota bacterium]
MRKLKAREIRLMVLLGILLGILGVDKATRYWRHNKVLESEHYVCYSAATEEQTQGILDVSEVLFARYTGEFGGLMSYKIPKEKLKLKLYKDRNEFKRVHRWSRWAEALYRKPYCHAYYDATEENPYHWMLHEAVHQLNREVAHLKLSKWLDEGVAEYFGTSKLVDGRLELGEVDADTYPIWWIPLYNWTGDFERDIENEQIIPLSVIVGDRESLDIDQHFNLYYIHWWSLVHFLFEYNEGEYRESILHLVAEGGTVEAFERHVGAIAEIEKLWYDYLLKIKQLIVEK